MHSIKVIFQYRHRGLEYIGSAEITHAIRATRTLIEKLSRHTDAHYPLNLLYVVERSRITRKMYEIERKCHLAVESEGIHGLSNCEHIFGLGWPPPARRSLSNPKHFELEYLEKGTR